MFWMSAEQYTYRLTTSITYILNTNIHNFLRMFVLIFYNFYAQVNSRKLFTNPSRKCIDILYEWMYVTTDFEGLAGGATGRKEDGSRIVLYSKYKWDQSNNKVFVIVNVKLNLNRHFVHKFLSRKHHFRCKQIVLTELLSVSQECMQHVVDHDVKFM